MSAFDLADGEDSNSPNKQFCRPSAGRHAVWPHRASVNKSFCIGDITAFLTASSALDTLIMKNLLYCCCVCCIKSNRIMHWNLMSQKDKPCKLVMWIIVQVLLPCSTLLLVLVLFLVLMRNYRLHLACLCLSNWLASKTLSNCLIVTSCNRILSLQCAYCLLPDSAQEGPCMWTILI